MIGEKKSFLDRLNRVGRGFKTFGNVFGGRFHSDELMKKLEGPGANAVAKFAGKYITESLPHLIKAIPPEDLCKKITDNRVTSVSELLEFTEKDKKPPSSIKTLAKKLKAPGADAARIKLQETLTKALGPDKALQDMQVQFKADVRGLKEAIEKRADPAWVMDWMKVKFEDAPKKGMKEAHARHIANLEQQFKDPIFRNDLLTLLEKNREPVEEQIRQLDTLKEDMIAQLKLAQKAELEKFESSMQKYTAEMSVAATNTARLQVMIARLEQNEFNEKQIALARDKKRAALLLAGTDAVDDETIELKIEDLDQWMSETGTIFKNDGKGNITIDLSSRWKFWNTNDARDPDIVMMKELAEYYKARGDKATFTIVNKKNEFRALEDALKMADAAIAADLDVSEVEDKKTGGKSSNVMFVVNGQKMTHKQLQEKYNEHIKNDSGRKPYSPAQSAEVERGRTKEKLKNTETASLNSEGGQDFKKRAGAASERAKEVVMREEAEAARAAAAGAGAAVPPSLI